MDAVTSQERWRLRGLGNVEHQPVVASGTLYLVPTVPGATTSAVLTVTGATGQRLATVAAPRSGRPAGGGG